MLTLADGTVRRYESLEDAIENAEAGSTITLIDDVTAEAGDAIPAGVTLNVTGHNYHTAPGDSDGQYVQGNPHNESWWYYHDKDSFNFCRMKLEEMSSSGPEILSGVPEFMFHSLDDVAVWNTYDGGKVVINIISGGEFKTVTDNKSLLSETTVAYDSGAVTNTFMQEE